MADPLGALLGVEVERDVECTTRDGVVLRADVYRPLGGGVHPVLLLRLPYDKTGADSNFGYAHPSWYARQGYLVVVQDTRGRYTSDGDFTPFLHEAEDGYDTVEWAAALPGSNGRVGMYGFSYPGLCQLYAAAEQPPSLVAIAPAFTGSRAYEGWTYRQGAFALAFAAPWAAFLALDGARRAGDEQGLADLLAALGGAHARYWDLPFDAWPPALERHAPYFSEWLDHPSHDGYWARFDADLERVRVPALHIGGWYDTFLPGLVESFVELSRRSGQPQKLVIGPWYHIDWAPVQWPGNPADVSAGWRTIDQWQLRWFDRFLGDDEETPAGSAVSVYVLGEGWREFDSWPPAVAQEQRLYLHSDGNANSSQGDGVLSTARPGDERPDVYVYDPLGVAPRPGGHSCCVPSAAPMGPACQSASETAKTMLVYTTAPLDRELVLIGDAHATLYAASSAVDTDFAVRLCVVDETGCSRNLQEGIVRARARDGAVSCATSPLVPGEVERYEIRLGPIGVRVRAGERVRVDVASSDFPQWDRNLGSGGEIGRERAGAAVVATQVVLHDAAHPSCVTLHVLDA